MDAFCNVAALNGEWREIAFYLEMSRQMKTTVHIKEFGGWWRQKIFLIFLASWYEKVLKEGKLVREMLGKLWLIMMMSYT